MDDSSDVNERRGSELSGLELSLPLSDNEMRFVLVDFDLSCEQQVVHVPTVFTSSYPSSSSSPSPPLPSNAAVSTMDIDITSLNGSLQVPFPVVLLGSSVFKHDLEMDVTSVLGVPSCASSQTTAQAHAQVNLGVPPCSSSQTSAQVHVVHVVHVGEPFCSSPPAHQGQLELQSVDIKPTVDSPSHSAPPASSCYLTDEESMMMIQEFMGSYDDANNHDVKNDDVSKDAASKDDINKDDNSSNDDGNDSKQQVRKDNIIKIIDCNINDSLAKHQLNEITEAVNQEFVEKVWDGCKGYVEKTGDQTARKTVQMWISEKKSLAEAIEESLKGYSDIYEKATAVRLYFEDEKSKFEQKVNNFNREANNQRSYSNGQNVNNSYFGNYDAPSAQHNQSNFATIDPYSIDEFDPSSSSGSNLKKRKQEDFSSTLNKDDDDEISNENSNYSNTSSVSYPSSSNNVPNKKQKPFFAGKFNSPLKDKQVI